MGTADVNTQSSPSRPKPIKKNNAVAGPSRLPVPDTNTRALLKPKSKRKADDVEDIDPSEVSSSKRHKATHSDTTHLPQSELSAPEIIPDSRDVDMEEEMDIEMDEDALRELEEEELRELEDDPEANDPAPADIQTKDPSLPPASPDVVMSTPGQDEEEEIESPQIKQDKGKGKALFYDDDDGSEVEGNGGKPNDEDDEEYENYAISLMAANQASIDLALKLASNSIE